MLLLLLALLTAVPDARTPSVASIDTTEARPTLFLRNGTIEVDSTGEGLRLAPLVVTATHHARALEDVPAPTTVLTAEAIAEQGALRLADLLAEQAGLQVTPGLGGAGLQVQGFDADYTLILLDGEPVVGRTAGALDLDRLAVTGVDRVEVVRGPLSARYGADALAGVVNLIPRAPGETPGARLSGRLDSHGASDFSAEAEAGAETWGVRGFINRFGSDGLSQRADGSLTVPAFTDYTGEMIARAGRGPTEATLHARLATEDQEGARMQSNGLIRTAEQRTDGSLSARLRHRFAPRIRGEARLYGARFANQSDSREADGTFLDATAFEHDFGKAEAGLSWAGTRAVVHGGLGVQGERVGGERYAAARTATQPFAFSEVTWMPGRALDVVLSARFDAPSDYAARFTPSLALLARPAEAVRLRASVGSGYKAPAFRQRYLVFTNAAGGYAVFGAEEAPGELAALDAAGAVSRYLLPVESLETLRAESSTAFGLGGEIEPVPGLRLRAHAFHNEVRDLIDTRAVAVLGNGQQVFSYFNLARIYTRGVEADLAWQTALPGHLGAVETSLGYQFLDTADRDVLDQIAEGELFYRDAAHRDVRLARSDYGGLFGRSRHSGTARLTHRLGRVATAARLTWRGAYGFADRNGNGALDPADDTAPGFALAHLTLTYTHGAARLQLGARNLLDHTDALYLPSEPGRTVFAGVGYQF